jgi:hypothetical protein
MKDFCHPKLSLVTGQDKHEKEGKSIFCYDIISCSCLARVYCLRRRLLRKVAHRHQPQHLPTRLVTAMMMMTMSMIHAIAIR